MSILSAVVGTPFVLMASNTFKNRGLLELLDYPLSVRTFDQTEAAYSDVKRAIATRERLARHLHDRVGWVHSAIADGELQLREKLALLPGTNAARRRRSAA
jgi:hypothetical protein